jgi:hypothetical protein
MKYVRKFHSFPRSRMKHILEQHQLEEMAFSLLADILPVAPQYACNPHPFSITKIMIFVNLSINGVSNVGGCSYKLCLNRRPDPPPNVWTKNLAQNPIILNNLHLDRLLNATCVLRLIHLATWHFISWRLIYTSFLWFFFSQKYLLHNLCLPWATRHKEDLLYLC